MSREEAREIAERLVAGLDLKGYKIRFANVTSHPKLPNEQSVLFDVFSPAGNLVDGPMIVIVDERTREARLMEGL